MNLIYPVVFYKEEEMYNVILPDFSNAVTCGDSLGNAIEMARDLIGALIIDLEIDKKELPQPSCLKNVLLLEGQFVSLVDINMEQYKKSLQKNIKKTLTIPKDINDEAENLEINFSKVLRDALKREIDVIKKKLDNSYL